jgi:hypothetical protein
MKSQQQQNPNKTKRVNESLKSLRGKKKKKKQKTKI